MFLTIPTIMTWTRIAAIPLIVGVFYLPESFGSVADKNLIATMVTRRRRRPPGARAKAAVLALASPPPSQLRLRPPKSIMHTSVN